MIHRSNEIIKEIEKTQSDPIIVHDLFNEKEINELLEIESRISTIMDEKGVKYGTNQSIPQNVIDKFKPIIGEFNTPGGNFFNVPLPSVVHVDSGKNANEIIYKAILIPLQLVPMGISNLIFFKQRWMHGAANFMKGWPNCNTLYNDNVYDYSDVLGLSRKPFPIEFYKRFLDHLPYSVLEGFEVEKMLQWKIGSAIIFDRTHIHCMANFRKEGIQRKIGLNLHTIHQ